nr:glycoside hydrolase family 18 protein [Colletotrichum truncatum]KAF6802020.1 glycoside hydrolase family 18 protein [Colletotrichum truncatum]
MGIATNTDGDFTGVQNALKGWNEAECVPVVARTDKERKIELSVYTENTETTLRARLTSLLSLGRRADCRTIQVNSGDGCGSLAKRCGISGPNFEKYNKKTNLCSTLQVGQHVCCSSGSLPNLVPKPQPNGICANIRVGNGDFCAKIAAAHQLTVKQVENFNLKKTWGWGGCDALQPGMKICLSSGDAPLPAPVSNAMCGPTKPGTTHPGAGKNISMLNPCPLNVCCNVWGNCGLDSNFCNIHPAKTGNPGTSAPKKNSCISNCGMDITNNKTAPEKHRSVGYFEGWNYNRPCLHMDADKVDPGNYGTIHFSFAEISTSFDVVIPKSVTKQFEIFSKMKTDQHKVLAFGGWDFSTLPGTFQIFRDAVKPGNREKFATNCVNFLKKHNLDGLDFDWEYPGAPDIPGIPPGGSDEGPNYLEFLKLVRAKLASGKTLSIAAPSSYWYLKQFPIKEMAPYLDYIVYMTYDLHGQWDYDNKWASPGCPEGNCLRSHVNLTETMLSLAIVTKAGVPAHKILVGVSSYGRSFKMTDPKCHGPNCHFVGELSAAKKGACTDTAGYIANAEILSIVEDGRSTWAESHLDNKEMTDYVVYDDGEWVAFMLHLNKWFRQGLYYDLNFGGISDWAVDLQTLGEGSFGGGDENDDENIEANCPETFDSLEAIEEAKDDMAFHCKHVYTLRVLEKMLKSSFDSYDKLIEDGYDKKYNLYKDAIKKMAPDTLVGFLKDRSNDFFNCDVREQIYCCDWCKSRFTDKECRYCDKNCNGYKDEVKQVRERCPSDTSLVGTLPPLEPGYHTYAVTWFLKSGKKDEFLAAALADAGLPSDWIGMSKDKQQPVVCAGTWECECGSVPLDECEHTGYWYDAPYIARTDDDGVSNPKDFVADAMKNFTKLGADLKSVADDIEAFLHMEDSQPGEIVEAAALPILMMDEAIQNMKKVEEIGEEIEKDKEKEFLTWFLTSILMLVPVVGQTLGTVARLATIGRAIAMLGEAGGIAYDVASIVDDPDNAPMAVFGLILGVGALRDSAKVIKASSAARGMSANDLGKLGGKVETRMTTISSVIGRSCSR